MESVTACSTGDCNPAVCGTGSEGALERITASVAALARLVAAGCLGEENRASAATLSDTVPRLDPLRQSVDDCLDGLGEVARVEACLAGLKVQFTAGYVEATRSVQAPSSDSAGHAALEMGMTAEVACVLTVSERTAGTLLSEAQQLTATLPLTLTALQTGTLSWQHARILCDETAGLDSAGAAALEAHFLDPYADNPARGCPAGELVPSRFRAKARMWRERHHPDSMETRHVRGAKDRRLDFAPDRDGMAWLSAYLPADAAAGIWNRTTAAARALQGPAEARTLTQLRADISAAWLLGGTADNVPAPKAQVLVTVPVFSLLGTTEEPGSLDGYGPIPASMARALVADGASSFHRVLTDPRTGAPLEIGRNSYRVPKAMRQWLRLRDGKCSFPGCSNHSLDNDADHLLAWADGGATDVTNLAQPCPKHHRLKHTTRWSPGPGSKVEPPGWTSPTGRHYQSEQPDWEPALWPELPEKPGPSERMNRAVASGLAPPDIGTLPPGPGTPQDVGTQVGTPQAGRTQSAPTRLIRSRHLVPRTRVAHAVLPEDPMPDWEASLSA
ncbi:DUF222 domain-containing protein [Arthrobacter sp. 24S4-2]|nr:DUF222 domain-containing protein [Arthrobacter sp. 24S4-2]